MDEPHVLLPGRNLLRAPRHLWKSVYVGRPHRTLLAEESQLTVVAQALRVAQHEAVPTGDIQSCGTVGLFNPPIEIVAQLRCHYLVGVDHEHPRPLCLLDSKRPGGLCTLMVSLGESHHPTMVPAGDVERFVFTLHIADKHLVEALHGIDDLLQILRRITRINDYGYPFFFVHRCKDTKNFNFHLNFSLFLLSLHANSIDQ